MAGAIDWVLTMQQEEPPRRLARKAKKRAHRRYADAVLALSKAFALAAASDEARDIRDEVGFFQVIRAALVKSTGDGKKSSRRTGARDPADCQPGRRLDRDRRHHEGRRH